MYKPTYSVGTSICNLFVNVSHFTWGAYDESISVLIPTKNIQPMPIQLRNLIYNLPI